MSSNGYFPTPVDSTKFVSRSSGKNGYLKTSFEAFLYRPINPGQLKLTIKLNVRLRQQSPRLITRDHEKKPFFSAPWNSTDWQKFVAEATAQANLWNNRFWIRPAKSFSQFDRKFDTFPGQAYRPNIRCELVVDFNPKGDAVATIDVANLSKGFLRLLGHSEHAGTFRSNAILWDSLDGTPWLSPLGAGGPEKHYMIAHELGHLLGLGHIGVLRKTAMCVLAQQAEAQGTAVPANSPLAGGQDALVCYGFGESNDIAGNVMGAGGKFTGDNAVPWLWAIMAMRGKPNDFPGWQMLTHDPGEGSWVKQ